MRAFDLDRLGELLEQVTSLEATRDYLSDMDLPSSAGRWSLMTEGRLRGLLDGQQMTPAEMLAMLEDLEEHGHVRVFLYEGRTKKRTKELLDQDAVMERLSERKLLDLIEKPKLLDEYGTAAQLTRVRFDDDGALIVKAYRTVTHYRPSSEKKLVKGDLWVRQDAIPYRYVNTMRLHPDGMLEVRLAAERSSTDYERERGAFWALANELIPRWDFKPLSLAVIRDRAWKERLSLGKEVIYQDRAVSSDGGYTLRASTTSANKCLSSHKASTNALDNYLKDDDESYADGSTMLWKKRPERLPTIATKTTLPNVDNQFALRTHTNQRNYGHVLGRIVHHNTPRP